MPVPFQNLFVELNNSITEQVPSFLANFIEAVVIAVLAIVASFVVRWLIRYLLKWLAPTWGGYLSNAAQIAILLYGLFLIINVTGVIAASVLLTMVTLFTAGASLSASSLINDGLATIRILTLGYYRVDDFVTLLGDVHGQVIEINAFSTFVRTREHDMLIVSNSDVVDDIIQVHTGFTGTELAVHIPVCCEHDRGQVMGLLTEVGENYAERLTDDEFGVKVFHQFASSSENYTLVVYVENSFQHRRQYTDLSIAAGNKLNAHGIDVGETNDNRNELSGTITLRNEN